MRTPALKAVTVAAVFCGVIAAAHAAGSGLLDDAALRAYAAKPWSKAQLMGTTVELGRYHGVPVVAEFRCGDVCPQYTIRIIHYALPEGAACASVGGVEQSVAVPVAIAVREETFCFPKVLVDAGQQVAH